MSALAPPSTSETVAPALLSHSITEAFDSILILDFGLVFNLIFPQFITYTNVFFTFLDLVRSFSIVFECSQKRTDGYFNLY